MTLGLLWTSLWISGCTAIGCVLLGGLSALWIAATAGWVRRLALGLVVVGAALPAFLVVDVWMAITGSGSVWHRWFGWSLFSDPGLLWVMIWIHWPIATLLLAFSWTGVDRSVLECDPRLRGKGLLWHVLLPAARGSFFQTMLLVFGLAMNQFSVPALLQARTLSAAMWIDFNTTYDFGAAMLKCVPQWIVLIAFGWRFSLLRLKDDAARESGLTRVLWTRLGRRFVLGCGAVFWCAVFFSALAPMAVVLGSPQTWAGVGGVVIANQGLIARTILTGVGAASLALTCGCLLSGWKAGWVLWAAFWTPGVAIGIGLIALFNRPGFGWLYGSWMVVLLGLALRYAGVAWTAARVGFGETRRELGEDFRLCGGGRWDFLVRVQTPLAAGKLAAAWYGIYLLSLWDVEILSIIAPPGSQTLSLMVFNLLHYGHTAQVMSLCLVLVGVALAPWVAWVCFRRLGALGLVLLAGCSGGGPENEVGIKSALFRGVQVVGTRGAGVGQFNKPRSVTADSSGRFFVVDMTGRVQRFSEQGEYEFQWQMPQTDLGKPKGMCLDSLGRIVVLEPHYSRVNHYESDGLLLKQWGKKGLLPGQFTQPRAAAINSHGEMYVAEFGERERVQRFKGAGDELLGSWGRAGTGPGEFDRPEGISVDAKDRVYVADSCNHRVQVFDREGRFLRAFGKPGSGLGEMSYPYDIQIDREGRVFVCEFGNSRVQVFDEHGGVIEVLGGRGDEPGKYNNPWSLALDPKGNLLVADSGNHRVQKLVRRR